MREQIEKRPSVVLLLGLVCGLAIFACPPSFVVLILLSLFLRPMPMRLAMAGAFVVGACLAPRQLLLIQEPTPIHKIGTVSTVPKLYPDGLRCVLSIEGRQILLSTAAPLVLGDDIQVSGIERPISAAGEDIARFLGVEGSIRLDRVRVVRHGTWLAQTADRWRRSFVSLTERSMDPREASLVDAVCFNGGSLLPPQTKQELEGSGLIHIVTASGLQVFVLAFLLGAVFHMAPAPRAVQFISLCFVLALYAMASGLNPAIVRAVGMSIAALGSCWFVRDPDPLSAMSLVGILYLLWSPLAAFNPGFQLSYAVVAAVCLFYRRVSVESGSKCFGNLMKEYGKGTVVLLVAAVPLSAYYFGSVSLLSVVANALICLTLPLLVLVAFLAYVVSWASSEVAGAVLGHFAAPLAGSIEGVVAWFGSGFGTFEVPAFSGYWLLVFYGAWAMTYRRRVVKP